MGGGSKDLAEGEIHSRLTIFFTGEALSAFTNILTACREDDRP
jgi:hypothetical protein